MQKVSTITGYCCSCHPSRLFQESPFSVQSPVHFAKLKIRIWSDLHYFLLVHLFFCVCAYLYHNDGVFSCCDDWSFFLSLPCDVTLHLFPVSQHTLQEATALLTEIEGLESGGAVDVLSSTVSIRPTVQLDISTPTTPTITTTTVPATTVPATSVTSTSSSQEQPAGGSTEEAPSSSSSSSSSTITSSSTPVISTVPSTMTTTTSSSSSWWQGPQFVGFLGGGCVCVCAVAQIWICDGEIGACFWWAELIVFSRRSPVYVQHTINCTCVCMLHRLVHRY